MMSSSSSEDSDTVFVRLRGGAVEADMDVVAWLPPGARYSVPSPGGRVDDGCGYSAGTQSVMRICASVRQHLGLHALLYYTANDPLRYKKIS